MADTETEAANRAALTEAFEGLSTGDGGAFMALFAPDIVWEVKGSSAWSGRAEGLEAVEREIVGPLFSRIDGPYRNYADLILADGDQVVVLARGEAKTVDGGAYNNDYAFVFTLEGGKIVRVREYMDTRLADAALGPKPGAA